jgi:DNA-binding winged helix-turn-helix (wHTH) protein
MFSFPSPRHFPDDGSLSLAIAPIIPVVAPVLAPAAAEPARSARLRFGRCEVRIASREVLVDGQPRPLQPRPFDLLVCLIESRDRVRTTDELLDEIWRHEMVQPGSLAAAVMRIRQAVGDGEDGIGQVIRTYPRVGYRFVAALEGDEAR